MPSTVLPIRPSSISAAYATTWAPGQSPESLGEYNRALALWLSNDRKPLEPAPAVQGLTINEVLLKFFAFVDAYYVKNGNPTREAADVRAACAQAAVTELYAERDYLRAREIMANVG
jgi:hypothetical protein